MVFKLREFHLQYDFFLLKARQPIFVKLLQSAYRVSQCSWLDPTQRIQVENCIRTLSEVGKLLLVGPGESIGIC